MSTSALKHPSTSWKRLACVASSLAAAAIVLLLPQTQQALPRGARPAQAAAARLFRSATILLPGSDDFWHTDGSRILNTRNHPIRISGMNWSGFETQQAVPGGLQSQDYRSILDTIRKNGYNTVRIPLSNEMVEYPAIPEHVRFSSASGHINADLRNLNSLQILDRIVDYAGSIGLKVILDNHRSEAGSSAQQSGLWYTAQFPESAWVEDWTSLANRYRDTSTVIGMDLRNEPHNAGKGGACWDCGGSEDWHLAAQRAGNAILAINPHLLIFVEGVDTYAGDTYWWGGNLEGVRRSPVHLSLPNHLVYSAHEYGPTEYAQPWFNSSTSPSTLASVWQRHWAFISEAGIAPVWIGEFGTSNDDRDIQSSDPGSEGQWFTTLVAFLGTHPNLGWTYWGVNGEDRYGLLDSSYSGQLSNQLKADALSTISTGAYALPPSHNSASAPRAPYTSSPVPFAGVQTPTDQSPSILRQVPPPASPSNSLVREQAQGVTADLARPAAQLLTGSAPRRSRLSVRLAIAANVQEAVSNANQSLANR